MSTCLVVRDDRSLSRLYESRYRPQKHLGKSKRTVEDFQSQIKIFNRFFAERLRSLGEEIRPAEIDDLSDELLAAAMAWQLDRNSAPTANKLYRVVTALWRFARRKGLIATMPEIEALDEDTLEPRTWTLSDYDKILAQTDRLAGYVGEIPASLFWRALILVIVNTAGRITAVMSIRTVDVDFQRNEILLRSLNQKQRSDQRFELQPSVLKAILDTHPDDREFLLPWPFDKQNTGREWQTLRRRYKRMLIAANLPFGSKNLFHNLRAFTATILADACGEEFARDYLGHSHISVLRRYLDRAQMKTKRSGVAHLPEPKSGPTLRVHQPEAS